MTIIYNPIKGSGPLRIVFEKVDLLKIAAIESTEETGVYWLENGKLLALEFEEVKSSKDRLIMTIPEINTTFEVIIRAGEVSVKSPLLMKLAG